jgi:hypothetical protein
MKLNSHFFNFRLHTLIFVLDVSDKSNAEVLESVFLLELKPFVLENIHCLLEFHLGQEVANEIVNHDFAFDCAGRSCILGKLGSLRRTR